MSEAGRALSSILTRLAKPPEEAAKSLNELGITVFDNEGKFIGLENVLGQLNTAFSSLTAEQQAFHAKNIAGQNYLGQFIEIVSQSDGTLQALTQTINDSTGSLEKMSATMGDNLQGKIDGMQSAIEGSLLQAFELLLPTFEKAVEKITDLANWFTNLDDSTQKTIITIGGVVGAIGPVLIVLGTLASSLGSIISFCGTVSSITGSVTSAFAGLGAGGTALGGILGSLSGVMLPALAVALTGLATIVGDNENMLNTLQEKFGSFGTVLGAVCEFISGVVQSTFGNMVSWVKFGIDSIAALIDGPGGATIQEAWKNHTERLVKNTEEGMNKITLSTTRGISQMKNAADKELNGVVNSFNAVLSEVGNIAEGNYKKASDVVSKELTNLSSNQLKILKGMNDTTKQMFKGIQEGMTVEEASKKVEQNLKNMAKNGDIDVKELEKNINSAMDMVKSNLDSKSKEGADKLTQNIDKATSDVKSSVDTMAQTAESGMSEVSLSFFDASGKIPPEIKKNMDQSVQAIKQAGSDMYNGVRTSFERMDQVCKQHATNMYKGVQTSAQAMAQSAKQSATDMYNGVTASSSAMASKVIADWNRIRSAISSPINASINVTKTERTQVVKAVSSSRQVLDGTSNLRSVLSAKAPRIEDFKITGGYYNLDNSVSNNSSFDFNKALEKLAENKGSNEVNVNLNIENFNNNRKQDIEQIMEEISYIIKKRNILGGV